jgi:hypothetical protein
MPVFSTRTQVLIGIALALLLAITRGNHFATLNLPSASWAVFFLAGVLLRPRWVFAGLFALASALDFSMLARGTITDWCLSPAYWMLVPAYATLWMGGRLYAGWHRDNVQSLVLLAAVVAVSALLCNLLSGGGFYFFSGRYPEPSLAGWLPRIAEYYPRFLSGMALYVGVACVLYVATLAVFSQRRSVGIK